MSVMSPTSETVRSLSPSRFGLLFGGASRSSWVSSPGGLGCVNWVFRFRIEFGAFGVQGFRFRIEFRAFGGF